MKKIYIYAIYFPTNDKYYVGQTNNLKGRLQGHLRSGSLICRALWKVDNWQISILHICKTRDEANRIEIEEIRNFNSIAPNGYNLTKGGEGFSDPTGEIAKKISTTLIGRKQSKKHRENTAKAGQGRTHSETTKEKMRRAKIGRKRKPFSKEHIEKLRLAKIKNQNAKGHKISNEQKEKMRFGHLKHQLKKLEQGSIA